MFTSMFHFTPSHCFLFSQGKREKKSSKKSKKVAAAAATVEDEQPRETGTGGGASGGAAELFDLDIGSQQKQEPVSRFQVLAEDDNLKMVGAQYM